MPTNRPRRRAAKTPNRDLELRAVREALRRASRATRKLQGHVGAIAKDDGSPVTIADLASQALILEVLGAAFPDDRVLAEESFPASAADTVTRVLDAVRGERAGANRSDLARWIDFGRDRDRPDRWWLLDPIDGTQGFLAGEQYAIAIALVEEGVPVFAGVACPRLGPRGSGLVFWADTRSAWRQRETGGPATKLRVSRRHAARSCRALESRHVPHSDQEQQARVRNALGLVQEARRMDGMGKYALLAAGEAELYLRLPRPASKDRPECAWDHAPGALLVHAAGGRVTDARGRPLDFSAGKHLVDCWGIVATNGKVHDAVLAAVA